MTEEWRDVVGYEGRYQVSNFGRVMSLGTGQTHKQKKILRTTTSRGKYLIVALTKDGKTKSHTVHRLVAMAFIPNGDKTRTQLDHIDGDSFNNRSDNLRWCTGKENCQNPITLKRVSESKKGELNPNHKSKLVGERREQFMRMIRENHKRLMKPVEQFFNCKFVARYESAAEAENITGITSTNISRCCSGQRKTAGKFEWRHAL